MTALDHTYRYQGASEIVATQRGAALTLVTSGRNDEHPFFFEGELTKPRLTALALRSLARIVGTRFFIPAAMLGKILALADPVVTSGRGMLRFEGFSGCASTYVRVDLTPEAYAGETAGLGTTNVDFNAGMRAALASVRDGEPLGLSVGRSLVVLKSARGEVVERKVPLPARWLKGFVEVQAYLARMRPFCELGGIEAMRFLRQLPRAKTHKHRSFLVPQGRTLRVSMLETTEGMAASGLERLRVLEELSPLARALRLYRDDKGQASAWELDLGALQVTVALSAEVWRGFSGEGQALSALARRDALAALVATLRAQLRWESALEPAQLARMTGSTEEDVQAAFRVLGARGLVGFDQRRSAFFHRELPYDLDELERLSPRLEAARELLDAGAVRALPGAPGTFLVRSDDVDHQVALTAEGTSSRCTCPWYAKHKTARGPCKHMLGAQLLWESGGDGDD
jgi:hypothetical protein